MTNNPVPVYGFEDTSYKAAGGLEGITRLVDDFYRLMEERSYTKRIFSMHPDDIRTSRDKLTTFLSGWLGGPRLYPKKYGAVSIPQVHAHLDIDEAEREAWLDCMSEALDLQPYGEDFKNYLRQQFRIPAERIYQTVKQQKS